jgi:hypothetical protein
LVQFVIEKLGLSKNMCICIRHLVLSIVEHGYIDW